jgi:hypothetical protein
MSKKRKRHQGTEESVSLNDDVAEAPPDDTLEPDEPDSGKTLTEEELTNIQKKIFHTVKETGRAFKKARDFELRKIIKRIKAAKSIQYIYNTNKQGRHGFRQGCTVGKGIADRQGIFIATV